MKPRITVITLAVDNLEEAVDFYRNGLGLPTDGIIGTEFEHGAVAFFQLDGGLRLALWPRASLARDSGMVVTPRSPTEMSIGHNVSSESEVDDVMRQAERAGARVLRPAGRTFWGGYAGLFLDPDDHLWEIVFNPAWEAAQ